MSDIAIRVEKLGKQYRIGKQERYKTLRDTLADTVTAPFRWLRNGRSTNGNGAADHFWALRDLSFEIPRGEVVGIIGRNGAGKSTLLKVLSRITEPTEGHAEIHGRVGSLLEVGTGFHPELTGRENVYLNGAILGMHKAEIARKFDEIVAFAEIEEFLDTPVKHYSSGMYMRLAFAVAAHLDPEILVVDEVLAVGDVAFQKKCLGKMGEVSRGGRTVLFVSHNMAAVQQLTRSSLLMSGGTLALQARTGEVVDRYMDGLDGMPSDAYEVADTPRRFTDLRGDVRFVRLWFSEGQGHVFDSEQEIRIHARLLGRDDTRRFRLSFTIFRADGSPVGSGFSEPVHSIGKDEMQDVELSVADHNLAPGRYHLGIAVGRGDHRLGHVDFDVLLDVCHFEVLPPAGDEGTLSYWASGWGPIRFESVESHPLEMLQCVNKA